MPTFVSRTSQQTFVPAAGGLLPRIVSAGHIPVDYHLLKCIALHPVVRLGIELVIGIITKSPWRIVANENSPHYKRFTPDPAIVIEVKSSDTFDDFARNVAMDSHVALRPSGVEPKDAKPEDDVRAWKVEVEPGSNRSIIELDLEEILTPEQFAAMMPYSTMFFQA